ncbi:MAG: heavy metal translocating P-type ATPase metal-binding domain-containing protein [Verrucomicrobiota bacterium]
MAKAKATVACIHCGTPFRPQQEADKFCCKGCEFVHGLIEGQGFGQFYQLKRGTKDPVRSVPFQPRQWDWLPPLIDEAESKHADEPSLILDLQGISCIGCVWLVEKLFARQTGSKRIEVNAQRGQMKLFWQNGAFDAVAFVRQLQQFGYLAGPPSARRRDETSGLTARLGLCGAFALNAMMFTLPRYLGMGEDFPLASWLELLSILFATLCLVVGGSYFISRALSALKQRVLHIDLPIAIGIVAAYLGSLAGWLSGTASLLYFDFVAIFIFLMLLGRWTQAYALERNRNRLLSANRQPEKVTLSEADGNLREAQLGEVRSGDTLVIQPGELVPVCARLEDASATFSLEWINGEPEPRTLKTGQLVPAGALFTGVSEISLHAAETWESSLLRQLLKLSDNPARNPALERVLKVYLACVLAIASLGGAAWLIMGGGAIAALQVFISVLVVSCPCALGVAYPLANELSVSGLRKDGVFVREESLWARLARVRHLIFDKTGTLTLESPQLRNPEAIAQLDSEAQRALTHLVERSLHPVSRALREELAVSTVTETVDDVVELVGYGLTWYGLNARWSLGRPGWNGLNEATISEQGRPFDCELRCNGEIVAAFSFDEAIRPDAVEEVSHFSRQGFKITLLSGDRQEKVDTMTQHLGLPCASGPGALRPQDKAEWIEQHASGNSLMIGDGANDSLAFDAALCRGTPVVDKGLLEQKADFYLVGSSLRGLSRLFATARKRQLAVRDILAFAISYNVIAVAVCLAGWMNPLLAAIIMPLSSLATLGLVGLRLGRR